MPSGAKTRSLRNSPKVTPEARAAKAATEREKAYLDAAEKLFGPGSLFSGNGELDVWHSFKIYGGQIHAAEAYCEIVPPGTNSGWGNATDY